MIARSGEDQPHRLCRLADSYLDHIRIAVEADDRGAPFRTFFDNWNAFQSRHSHHRSKGSRPRWFNNPSALTRIAMFDTLDFQSRAATTIISQAAHDPVAYKRRCKEKDGEVRLIVDHAVPVAVLMNSLFSGAVELSRNGVREYLLQSYHLGLLSDEEDRRLNAMGLRSAMPSGWDGNDPFARYQAAGIAVASPQ